MSIIHIGRKVPKGFIELEGSVHIGKGIWIFKIKPKEDKRLDAEIKE